MKLPASDKTSSYGKKPHIKKGYYPAKLIKVEPFTDSDGKPKEGKYGRQLIFEFAVYKADSESGEPVEPLWFQPQEDNSTLENVIIPKFVYHEYKNKKTGEFQTAITPNSAITKILKSLGWNFSAEGVDIDELIGNWVEVNVDDYEQTLNDETYSASTIKDINPYKGPKPKNMPNVKPKEIKKVEKPVEHEVVKEDTAPNQEEIGKLKSQIEQLKNLHKDGFLTDGGLKQAVEQLETKLGELEKK